MKFVSTRGGATPVTVSTAIGQGLASDGGLFVPARFPRFDPGDFADTTTLVGIARILLEPFFRDDPLRPQLADICRDAFSFPIPLRPVEGKPGLAVLELFHGPTAAFKDVGARFLAACLERLEHASTQPLKILVATSGDTGGAVAAAFHGREGIQVFVLYPAGLVSPRQEQQLTCWGDNVAAFRVAGAFDDCQRLVKSALSDAELAARIRLTSANSINIGRLLPQAVYYAAASLWHWREHGHPVAFIVPTGNLGNAVAAVWARHMGLPIGPITLATNANRVIPDFLRSGRWEPQQSLNTLASAMDVGNPSNMERLRNLYPDFEELSRMVDAWAVSDAQIQEQIVSDYRKHDVLWCPHTATAAYIDEHYKKEKQSQRIVVATAHPAKFETVIEPLIGKSIPVPPSLAELLDLPATKTDMQPDAATFATFLLDG